MQILFKVSFHPGQYVSAHAMCLFQDNFWFICFGSISKWGTLRRILANNRQFVFGHFAVVPFVNLGQYHNIRGTSPADFPAVSFVFVYRANAVNTQLGTISYLRRAAFQILMSAICILRRKELNEPAKNFIVPICVG